MAATGAPELGLSRSARRARARAEGETIRSVAIHIATICVAIGCWLLALRGAAPGNVSGWGLLGVLPRTYLVGLAILAIGFSTAASSHRVRPAILAAYVVALVAMLTLTTALLFTEPRYDWVYKHLGIIDYIRIHGSADRSLSIYTNWPAFFALNAWFSHALGISPLAYANWAQCFFDLANVAGVLFVVRGVTRNVRAQWTAAWLFVVANWVGQDYLAPQSFAFFLSLVAIGLVLRCGPMRRAPRMRLDVGMERFLGRLASRLLRGQVPQAHDAAPSPIGVWSGMILAGGCYLGVVLTHQLSPILDIVIVAVLCVTVRRPPVWVVVVMAAVEAWWVWLAYPFVSTHFHLFSFDPSVSARLTYGVPQHPLAGVVLSEDLSRAAIVLIVLVAARGVMRRIQSGHWDPAGLVLVGAPALIIPIQSYNGEGPLRSYLFALPFIAFLGAAAVAPRLEGSLLRRSWPLLAVTFVVGGCSLTGIFGQDSANYFQAEDVSAATWWLDHSPPNSTLTYLAPDYPGPSDANFATHLQPLQVLVQTPGFPHTLPAVERVLACQKGSAQYIAFTPSQIRYLRLYGLMSQTSYSALLHDVSSSPDFKLRYRDRQSFVFLFTGGCARSFAPTPFRGRRAPRSLRPSPHFSS